MDIQVSNIVKNDDGTYTVTIDMEDKAFEYFANLGILFAIKEGLKNNE